MKKLGTANKAIALGEMVHEEDLLPLEEKKGYAYNDIDCIIWDLETTGFVAPEARILEIGAIIISGDEIEHKHWVINEGIEIPEKITEITGITKAIVEAEGRSAAECLTEFIPLLSKSKKNVTHNGIKFDIPFLAAYATDVFKMDKVFERNLAIGLSTKAFDTAVHFKARKIGLKQRENEDFLSFATRVMNTFAKGVYFNLKVCCEEQGVDMSKITLHRAMGDVAMTHELYKGIIK